MATEIKKLGDNSLKKVFEIAYGYAKSGKEAATQAAKTYTDDEIGKLPKHKAGTGIAIAADGTISATGDAAVNPSALPKASKTQIGGVKIGDGVDVDADGVISVSHPDVYTKTEADGKFQTAEQVAAIANQKAADKIAALVDGAPESLDTLKEIADTLNKDTEGGVVNAIMTEVGKKANSADVYTTTAADAAIDGKVNAAKTELNAAISGKATPADVATAKQEAITAAATSAAGLYVPKTDMPTFTEYTATEIQAIADAAVAAL